MEKNSWSHSLKDHNIGSPKANNNNNKKNLKDSWNYNNQTYGDQDYLSGFSWPPRSYTCTFCKREFRSAQALGGHMNVHRRDRARLRQSPPPRDAHCRPILSLNINQNPNPSFSTSSLTCTLPSFVSPPLFSSSSPSFVSKNEIKKWAVNGMLLDDPLSHQNSSNLTKMEARKSFLAASGFDGFTQKDGCKFLKKAEIARLELEIGVARDHNSKEDLDLELRLGYS